ncbi:MAG: ArsC/Spx/MgsR family protein [Flavobacteriaceae bacterium]|nr:ArsC/Spx/MgsR family protein [Flavobacteriaceae bacterium]
MIISIKIVNFHKTKGAMRKIYVLKNSGSCKEILRSLPLEGFVLQDIKSHPITVRQLEEMHTKAGSYEALFSKMAKKYKECGLKNESLSEKDLKQLILDEYTFLKRPVVLVDDRIFIGSSKKSFEDLRDLLKGLN